MELVFLLSSAVLQRGMKEKEEEEGKKWSQTRKAHERPFACGNTTYSRGPFPFAQQELGVLVVVV